MSDEIKAKTPRAGLRSGKKKATRQEQLRKLLKRKSGATIAQIQTAFGWQPHTARAAISMQRSAGHVVERTNNDKASVYRIVRSVNVQ